MADQKPFFDLLDIMETEKTVEPKRFFGLMRSTFNIANLLYVDLDVLSAGFTIRQLHHTFNARIVRAYIDAGLHRINPILRLTMESVRPIDWATARQTHPEGEPLFSAASKLGFGLNGVTLPLPAPARRLAFLAIHVDVPAQTWPAYRRHHLRDFQLLANLFHASVLENDDADQPSDRCATALTDREIEVLGWAAAGKSYWEIGTILGISERTVRFFMTNARRKLNVVSNTQAVAQAVRYDLIPSF